MKTNPRPLRAKVSCLVWMLAFILAPTLMAQTKTVTGTVYDTTGDVVIGATVSVKGQPTIGAATDLDGKYELRNVPDEATLIFSLVGFQSVEKSVKGQSVIDATMSEDTELLDEVVVVGYGTVSRREVSSSIVQVNKDDFQQGAMNNAMEMLQGKVAGLNVSSTASANPNGSADLQVRGATSLSAGNGPLIVIDGVAGGDIRTLAP